MNNLPELLLNVVPRRAKPRVNSMRFDPSRTGLLRARWSREIARRFALIRKALLVFIQEEDALGLNKSYSPGIVIHAEEPRRYAFMTSMQKLRIFREKVKAEVDKILLEGGESNPWTDGYVNQAFKRGLDRAFGQVRHKPPSDRFSGARAEFLGSALKGPEVLKKIELIAARTFEGMKGLTEMMKTGLNRELANALTYGQGVVETARKLNEQISIGYNRALLVARTEIIHSHAEGQLEAMKQLGVAEVGAEVEWSTAGDARVCPRCAALEGKIFKVKDAEGLIPLHPNCRCAWIPFISVPKE